MNSDVVKARTLRARPGPSRPRPKKLSSRILEDKVRPDLEDYTSLSQSSSLVKDVRGCETGVRW